MGILVAKCRINFTERENRTRFYDLFLVPLFQSTVLVAFVPYFFVSSILYSPLRHIIAQVPIENNSCAVKWKFYNRPKHVLTVSYDIKIFSKELYAATVSECTTSSNSKRTKRTW